MGSGVSSIAVQPEGIETSKSQSSGGLLKRFRYTRKEKQQYSDSSDSSDSDNDDLVDDEEGSKFSRRVKSTPKNGRKKSSKVSTNWEEHVCPQYHCLYYFNTVTGESTWNKPDCFGTPKNSSIPGDTPNTPPRSSSARHLLSPPTSAPPLSSMKKSEAKKKKRKVPVPGTVETRQSHHSLDISTRIEDDDSKAAEYISKLIPWAYEQPTLYTAIEAVRALPKERLDYQDAEGNTLLALAAQHRIKAVAQLLVELGADVNICNKGGSTALSQVCAVKDDTNKEIANLLIHAGASNSVDKDGCTPLHWAASCGDQLVCTALLRFAGADVTLTDSYGFNPIQYAREAGHENLARELETFGRANGGIGQTTSVPTSSNFLRNPTNHGEDLTEASMEEQAAWVAKEAASLSARSQFDGLLSDDDNSGISPPNNVGPETESVNSEHKAQTLHQQLIAKDQRILESELRLKTALSLCNKLLSVNRGLMPKTNPKDFLGGSAAKLPPLNAVKKNRPVMQKLQFEKLASNTSKNPATAMGLPAI